MFKQAKKNIKYLSVGNVLMLLLIATIGMEQFGYSSGFLLTCMAMVAYTALTSCLILNIVKEQ